MGFPFYVTCLFSLVAFNILSFSLIFVSDGKPSVCNAEDLALILGSGRSLGEGNGNPLQSSCLGKLWTEEPGGLQFMELLRVGHDLATEEQHQQQGVIAPSFSIAIVSFLNDLFFFFQF